MQESQENTSAISPSDEERLEEILQRMHLNEVETDHFRSLLRLLVGGAVLGWDELLTHLEQWEEESQSSAELSDSGGSGTIVFVEPGSRTAPPLSQAQELRYMLVGMLFESESRIYQRFAAASKFTGQTTSALLNPVMRWMNRNPRFDPARSRFDRLVQRGEAVTDRWIQRGIREESHGRRMVLTATQDTFDASMEQLGQAPELQNLVKMQSAGLSREVLDEVRSRTVSGDYVAEGFVRRVLRRTPRRELPTLSESENGDESASQES
ncbi:MAG: hypothetical protein ACK2T3_03365 [Candidatus Promineifilaceae bacterium]